MFHRIMNINWPLVFVNLIVHGFLVMAAWISYTDIRTLAIRWGVYVSLAWTAPLFIDGLTWMGKLGRSKRLDEGTRRGGLVLMGIGGTMSLVANIAVGENTGMRVYGGLVVLGYVVAEWFSGRLAGVTKRQQEQPTLPKERWVVDDAEKAWRKASGWHKLPTAAEKAKKTMEYRERRRRQQARELAASGATA